MLSSNNQTFTPLQSNRSYVGSIDKVQEFSSATISLYSDENCLIQMVQLQAVHSPTEYVSSFNALAGTQFNLTIDLTMPIVYFTVRNEGSSTQTVLSFTVLYKKAFATSSRVAKKVWTNQAVLTNGTSQIVNLTNTQKGVVSIFGTTSVLGNLTVEMSDDGLVFYPSQYSANLAVGPFGFTVQLASQFTRLIWGGNTSTITCHVSAC